jgi:hypothetical protein
MCQSSKIAEVMLRAQKIPANDNRAPVEKTGKPETASLFRVGSQTLLVFCCAVALLLL